MSSRPQNRLWFAMSPPPCTHVLGLERFRERLGSCERSAGEATRWLHPCCSLPQR